MSLFSRIITTVFVFFVFTIEISAAQPFITTEKNSDVLVLKEKSVNLSIFTNSGIDNGILRAVKNLQSDFQKVTGTQPTMEFKKPLDLDYDNENSRQIMEKIMHAIEQTDEFNVLHQYDLDQKAKKEQE